MGSKDGRERSLGSGGQCVRQLGFPPQEDLGRFPHHLVGVRLVFVEIESYPFVTFSSYHGEITRPTILLVRSIMLRVFLLAASATAFRVLPYAPTSPAVVRPARSIASVVMEEQEVNMAETAQGALDSIMSMLGDADPPGSAVDLKAAISGGDPLDIGEKMYLLLVEQCLDYDIEEGQMVKTSLDMSKTDDAKVKEKFSYICMPLSLNLSRRSGPRCPNIRSMPSVADIIAAVRILPQIPTGSPCFNENLSARMRLRTRSSTRWRPALAWTAQNSTSGLKCQQSFRSPLVSRRALPARRPTLSAPTGVRSLCPLCFLIPRLAAFMAALQFRVR